MKRKYNFVGNELRHFISSNHDFRLFQQPARVLQRASTIFCILVISSFGVAETNLYLGDYLTQVKEKNEAIQASRSTVLGASERAHDGELLTTPNLFANVTWAEDGRPTAMPLYQGTKSTNSAYSLGVSQMTDFGLSAKLSYNLSYTSVEGAQMLTEPQFNTAYPAIELTQQLWRNGLGREIKAQKTQSLASAQATTYAERFKMRASLADAESTYWKLVLARDTTKTQTEALDRAKRIMQWAANRVRLNLADRSILLQTTAVYNVRRLDLQSAIDDEKAACRAFNSLRNVNSDQVSEKLELISDRTIQALMPPTPASLRDDVKAAEQQKILAQAAGELGQQRDTPSLDIFGSLSLNGKDKETNTAISDSFKTDHRFSTVGIKFSAPLDFELAKQARGGYLKEQRGAELNYQRKLFEQEQTWTDIINKFSEAKRRVILATEIEKNQKEKWIYEKDLLTRGRSTTSQVLTFETDFQQSQLARIRAEGALLTIYAQMKVFEDGEL